MKSVVNYIKKNALKITGTAALFVGAIAVTQLKMVWFYQPECPEILQK